MSRDASNRPVRKNDLCTCGSGLRYKVCCITREVGNTKVVTSVECSECNSPLTVDLSKLPLFQIPDYSAPLRHFAREQGIYFFASWLRMVQVHELTERLKSDELTVADLMQVFVAAATREVMMSQLDCAVGELQSFSEREHIIRDAINAHFDGKYSLSVPVGFLLLEGVLRSLGGLTLKEDLAVSIPRDRWENRLAPEIQARADSFRSFVTNIFKGSQDVGTFNRNPVLHGAAVDYHREDWSLMLLMSLFEIRMFMFYRKFPETIT